MADHTQSGTTMQAYISLLRGINVSGQKKILMADLKDLYLELGLRDVTTYIQSGNVVFRGPGKAAGALAGKIIRAIAARWGFDVPVILRTLGQMQQVIRQNPFLKERGADTDKMYVTFLMQAPPSAQLAAIDPAAYIPDRFITDGTELFLLVPGGYGRTKLTNTFFEGRLKTIATTRNWNTVLQLEKMAGELEGKQ